MASIQTQYAIFLSILLTTIFFFKVNSVTNSFSIPKFRSDQQNLILQGDAYTTDGKLILNNATTESVGRALYFAPIHIWDRRTDNVASFTTSFTFVIKTPNRFNFADGITFFIAPVNTEPRTTGGYLGVFDTYDYDYDPTAQIVAVEFDTFYNPKWDPNYKDQHIGIDVNSIKSIEHESWKLQKGEKAKVVISFDGTSRNLDVSLTYPNSLEEESVNLRAFVQLEDVVPEWVRIGFSGSTGGEVAAHEIHSWTFQSDLRED